MKRAVLILMAMLASSAFADEKFFEIKAKKFFYTPNIIKVNRGDLVSIRLISEDVHHGLYLDGYEEETSAIPGQDGIVRFAATKPGRFVFRCSVTCGEFHPYMIGYLIVAPNINFYGFVILTILLGGGSLYLIWKKKNYSA